MCEQKVIVVIADFGYVEGGAAKVALDSVRLLHEAGYEVILFCGSERVDPSVAALGIRIEKLGMPQLKDNPSRVRAMVDGLWNRTAARRLQALMSELDPLNTVVHVHSWTKILSPSVFSVLRKSGFKTVMTAHDYFLACPNGAFYDYVHNRLCPYHGGSLKCLFCNCDVRNYVQKVWRWVRQKIVTYQIKRFTKMTLLTISNLSDEILKRELGATHEFVRVNNPLALSGDRSNGIHGKSDFFFVGRASPEKGLDLFAEAVTACDVHGVVVGDGASLQDVRKRYPRLECFGWVDPQKVRGIIRSRAAVLVFPSRLYETAGLTPLEAMAEGIPCIIADKTASAEYVEDGKTGLLFRTGDVHDLKRKVVRMKDSELRKSLSENISHAFNILEWSEKSYVDRMTTMFQRILAG